MFDIFKFKKSDKTNIIHDDIFGDLEFIKSKHGGFFSGRIIFSPIGSSVSFSIKQDNLSYPNRDQKEFFKKLISAYPIIENKIAEIFKTNFREAGLEILDFKQEFILTHISINECHDDVSNCELTFEQVQDKNHDFRIVLNNLEPENYLSIDS